MTTTTISRVALLHALADHVERHDLSEDISGIAFYHGCWDGLKVQVHHSLTVARWAQSLDAVTADAHRTPHDDFHVTVAGEFDEVPIRVVWVCTKDGDPAEHAALSALLKDAKFRAQVAIELPDFLGGAR